MYYRGRWKNNSRIVETYISADVPYVDAKAAAALCKGGAVVYVVLEASGVTDGWICDHIVPNILRIGVPLQVCVVLGRALLWRLFDGSGDAIPPQRKAQMLEAYRALGTRNTLVVDQNPVVVSFVFTLHITCKEYSLYLF